MNEKNILRIVFLCIFVVMKRGREIAQNALAQLHKTAAAGIAACCMLLLTPLIALSQQALPPVPGQLLLSEVLFDPPEGGSDYVELYNDSYDDVALDSVALVKVRGDSTLGRFYPVWPGGVLPPHAWLVVTVDAAWVQQRYALCSTELLHQVPALPAWANDHGTVLLTLMDSTMLDRLDYNEKMHSSLLREGDGAALERRDYAAATQDAANWSTAASTAGFGTPTCRNSLSMEFPYTYADFMIQPDIFSPDGDGHDDNLIISYTLPESALTAQVAIYDIRGRKVRTVARNALLGAQGSLSWDGRDENGTRCLPGNYIVLIQTCDAAGLRRQHKTAVALMLQ